MWEAYLLMTNMVGICRRSKLHWILPGIFISVSSLSPSHGLRFSPFCTLVNSSDNSLRMFDVAAPIPLKCATIRSAVEFNSREAPNNAMAMCKDPSRYKFKRRAVEDPACNAGDLSAD